MKQSAAWHIFFAFSCVLLYNNLSYTFVYYIHKTGEKKVRDFLAVLEDFCADNYIWVITGAAVILAIIILIVTGSGIRAKRRGKQDLSGRGPREFFMEGEYDAILKERAETKVIPTEEPDRPEVFPKEKADEAEEGNNGEIEIPTEHPLSININIERGRVQIGLGDCGETLCRIDEIYEEEAEEKSLPDVEREMPQFHEEIEAITKEKPEKAIVMEKISLVKGTAVKKFGKDNPNTTRSGRVYTEEELRKQIKE